jgi:hypothetical protein
VDRGTAAEAARGTVGTMDAPQPATAAQRTAALRTVARTRWPGVRFSVRPGPGGSTVIRWTDGPDFAAVEEALDGPGRRFTAWLRS